MNMIPVTSSNIHSVGYEGTTLAVLFHSGGLYEYYGVPQSVYSSLMNASSKGGYLAAHITGCPSQPQAAMIKTVIPNVKRMSSTLLMLVHL